MAKFSIIPKGGGTARYSGTPTYTGTYMKPGTLEFREIASPTPIPFAIGDYVVYSRTGRTYRLYQMPQVKKQAASTKYGGGFLYQNVQFKDDSYQLEICPFRDLVVGDNRVHFSTQPLIAVFDNVAGIAERIQACLEDMYGAGSWVVRLATTSEGLDQDTADLMEDDRDFSVSGVSCLGVLDKIYEIWPNVGWVFKVESGVNTIVIGGAGLNVAQSSSYGKGNGLLSITRTVANADELANRLYVYGSNRNMLSRWYSQFDIKDAESVDIQNLMLPIEKPSDVSAADYNGWGITNTKRDPAKAFVEDSVLAAANLRPKTVYFDGSGDFKEIYPTIEGITIAKLLSVIPEGTLYRPDPTKYSDTSVRVDKVLSVNSSFDSGLAANNGRETVQSDYRSISASRTHSVTSLQKFSMLLGGTYFSPAETGSMNLNFLYEVNGTVALTGIKSAQLEVEVRRGEFGPVLMRKRVDLEPSETTAGTFIIGNASFSASRVNVTSSDIYVTAIIIVEPDSSSVGETATLSASGTLSFSMERYRAKTFNISLRQLGFDISAQALLGEGKTIAMRSGNCVGRSFRISSTSYDAATDTWNLEVIRSNDESLSQWFPNSSYPIVAGDEFVLLDIAMPSLYVSIAEHNLLDAALELLADTKVEQWQYTPEVDAKFMVENSRTINAGEVIGITDTDVVVDAGPFLVDSVTINEGESAIPTYKVTLRERKKKSYSDKASVPESTSTPVTTPSQTAKAGATVSNNSFFEEDGNGGVKLKDEYTGLWTNGFVTAGGPGSGGGGGGGGADLTDVWASFQNTSEDTTRNSWKIATAHLPNLGAGLAYTDNGESGANLSTTLSIASGYKLPTNEEWAGIASNLEGLQALQSQVDSLASRNFYDELIATAIFSDVVAASALYAGSIELNGVDLATTLSGYFLASNFTAANIVSTLGATAVNRATSDASGNNIANTYATNTALNGVSSRVTTLESRQNWDEIFGIDSNGNVYVKKQTVGGEEVARGFWNYGFVTAGGPGSGGGGGGGGTDLTEVWASLQNTSSDTTHNAWKISTAHLPTLGAGLTYTDDAESGANLDTTLGIASGYKLPTVEEWGGIVSNLEGLQALQGQIDSVASRDSFDELVTSALFADVLSAGAVYASSIEIGGVDLESSYGASISFGANSLKLMAKDGTTDLSSLTGADIVTVLSTNSVARATGDADGSAIKTSYGASLFATANSLKLLAKDGTTALTSLTGSDIVTVLSTNAVARATGDADGNAIKSSYGASLTAASNALKLMAKDGTTTLSTITGENLETVLADRYVHNTTDTMTGALGVGYGSTPSGGEGSSAKENRRLYFGGSSYYIELVNVGTSGSPVWAFHFSHGLYSDSFVTAGGPGSGSGGSTDITAVWASLQNTDSDTTRNSWKIAAAHLPTLNNGLTYTDNGGSGAGLNVTLGIASGYKLPTNAEWENISDNLAGLQTLQAQIDSVASRDGFDEITTTAIFADVASVSALYVYSVELNGADLATTLAGKQATISDLSTIRNRADEGHTAYGWGNHANAGYFSASSFTAANIVSTLGATAVNRATSDASGENISDCFSTVSSSLQSLQAQINSVASRDVYDELSVANLFVDTLAVSKIFADGIDFGGYTFGASGSVMQWNGSALFYGLSSSAATNLSITVGGQNRTTALYATYDSSSENISDKFSIVSSALQSLQNQISSVAATVGNADETYAGCGFFDTLSVGDGIYAGSLLAMGYVTAGASASSSDARLKNNIEEVPADRAVSLLMKLRGVEWDWNEKKSAFEGKHGSGLVAQEVDKVMPWMVLDLNGELSLTYSSLWGVAVPVMQNHEKRIVALEKENAELKKQLYTLTH